MLISAVILAKNEEKNIKDCIGSVKWCDEIVVIDDDSVDKTVEVSKKIGAIVYEHALENDFAAQRNFGLEKARGDWIFFIDADERVSANLAFEVQGRLTENPENIQGFFVKRVDSMWGKTLKHGETGNISFVRLAKKGAGFWHGKVHEELRIQGKTSVLHNSLFHFPHQTITEFLQEINFYTSLRAEELFKQNVKVFWWDIILYPKGKFIVNFFLKQGFRDGIEGFILALLMSLHSFLVRGKLWILWHKK